MPRNLLVNPQEIRKARVLTTPDIPMNQYKPNIAQEKETYGEKGLKEMLYDMLMIREFEEMLDSIKKEGHYKGLTYDHRGPAHLSIGQEAAAVGQAYHLTADDFIFGSHRSHGEILAKCLSAIRKLSESELTPIMEEFLGGETLGVVKKHHSGKTIHELAEHFVLYGALAEIFARKTGFSRGLGGSMHTFFAPFGSMPNNAIVGGSGDIAVGSALYKKINRKKGIVIANIGDAAMACGPVWEGLALAAMDQYKTLWEDNPGAPPYMLNVFNNFYGMGGQTSGETMGYGSPARVGAGVNPKAMHAEGVDGFNPIAVAEATARKKEILLKGEGPVLQETITYRLSGHSPSDASSYRSKEEMELFKEADCVAGYANYLMEHGVLTEEELHAYKSEVEKKIYRTMELAIDPEISGYVDDTFIESVMYSNGTAEALDTREPELLTALEENPQIQQLAKKHRYAFKPDGKPQPGPRTYAYRDAIFEAMVHRFAKDPTMIAYGEENRDWGGAFACYRGLTELLPYHRLFNSPISEASILGSGVGYAMSGGRAVVELMYADFMGRAGDQIFNQIPKWQSMSAGELKMPLVCRVSVGNKYGAQHSQDWTALVSHIPGLKVMFPATPYDAKGMLNLALRGTDPVMFFESQKLYGKGEEFITSGVPEGYYEIPEGEPVCRREGKDLTILTIGATLYEALKTAEVLEKDHGISAEVWDLRFINPLNYQPLVESVKKTGRVLLASDACERGSFLHNVASNITNLAFDYLDAPPAVVGAKNWITPPAEMEDLYFPQVAWFLEAIHQQIVPLKNYTPRGERTAQEMINLQKRGI